MGGDPMKAANTARVALVTGGAGGIGRATAERLAADGVTVVIADLDEAAARVTATEIGSGAQGIGIDVADEASVDAVFEGIAETLGRVDVVVNNAGVLRDNLIHKMTVDDWELVLRVHLRGAFLVSRAAQRIMVPQGGGRIISLSSIAATGNRGQSNYSAAKAGIIGLTKTLAIELGRFGITVNAVAPGYIATAMTDATALRVGVDPSEYRAQAAEATPLRRVGSPADVAGAIAFLAGEDASFITGQVLVVDGGLDL